MRILDFRHKKRRPLTSIDVPMVPKAGLEPARISTVDFESTASTDFATSALKGYGNVLDYTCRRRSCKRQRVVIALSVEKTALSCAASPFAAIPQRDCHQQPSPHSPENPAPPASHPPFSTSGPKPHSNLSQIVLTSLSPASLSPSISPQTNPQYPLPQYFPQPHPSPFLYIPESFSQYLFVIHSLRSQILISSIFL